MIEALKTSFGIVTRAAKLAEISPESHYLWLKADAEYAQSCIEAVQLAKDHRLDILEQLAMKRSMEGSDSMIQFQLKMLGKERGYIERTETKVTTTHESETDEQLQARLAALREETGGE